MQKYAQPVAYINQIRQISATSCAYKELVAIRGKKKSATAAHQKINHKKPMTSTKTIIMASFLSTLFGCGGQKSKPETTDVFPIESFSVVEAKLDDKPVIGSFNMAYKNYDKKDKYPWCLKISIALDLNNLFENGLPKTEETSIANKLEDELLAQVKKITTAHYIGHLFNDTFLDVYIYLDDPKKVHDFLQTQVNKPDLIRGFGYEMNNDPKWATVSGFMK